MKNKFNLGVVLAMSLFISLSALASLNSTNDGQLARPFWGESCGSWTQFPDGTSMRTCCTYRFWFRTHCEQEWSTNY